MGNNSKCIVDKDVYSKLISHSGLDGKRILEAMVESHDLGRREVLDELNSILIQEDNDATIVKKIRNCIEVQNND